MSDVTTIYKACLKMFKNFLPGLLILIPIGILYLKELRETKNNASYEKEIIRDYAVTEEAARILVDYPELYYFEAIEKAKDVIKSPSSGN